MPRKASSFCYVRFSLKFTDLCSLDSWAKKGLAFQSVLIGALLCGTFYMAGFLLEQEHRDLWRLFYFLSRLFLKKCAKIFE